MTYCESSYCAFECRTKNKKLFTIVPFIEKEKFDRYRKKKIIGFRESL